MLEKDIEKQLKRKVESRIPGAMCMKFVSPGISGVPDRMILLPYGVVVFVELKRPGEVLRPLQRCIVERMRKIGQTVFEVDNPYKVDILVLWLEDVMTAMDRLEPVPPVPESLSGGVAL